MHEIVPVHDDVKKLASNFIVRDSTNEPRSGKRLRVETSFSPEFLTTFFIEDCDVNFSIDELVCAFFMEEDPKSLVEALRSIYASF